MNPPSFLLAAVLPVARLLTPLPVPPVMSSAAVSALCPAASSPPEHGSRTIPANNPPTDDPELLRPTAGGTLDLVGALNSAQNQADQAQPANPFRLRFHPPIAGRAVPVRVEAVILGEAGTQSCCMLNHQALHLGDRFEGLSIAAITADQIILGGARYRLALPVDDRSITLELPNP